MHRPPNYHPAPFYRPPLPYHYPVDAWRHGAWRYENHLGLLGWWWIIGNERFMYPKPIYPYPAPTLPYVYYAAPGGSAAYAYGSGYDVSGSLLSVLLAHSRINLSPIDQTAALQAEETAYMAPLGQSIVWRSPGGGASGTYMALRDGYDQNGFYCREYQMTLSAYGLAAQDWARACLDASGRWRLANTF